VKKGVQTVPLDGGAVIASNDLTTNINSSYPDADGKSWAVYVNNGTSTAISCNVYAVGAKKLKNWVERFTVTEPDPAGSQNGHFFVCRVAR
jgi:hypothetical protein